MKPAYRAIVVGASAGGLSALKVLFSGLHEGFPLPILVVQHTSADAGNFLTCHLDSLSRIRVKEADEKERILPGTAYVAPPNYHLLVEPEETLSLSADERVKYSRPSIDVLFESAVDAFGQGLIGIVLTGANDDGSAGLKRIKDAGGLTVVQEPSTAEVPTMPLAAIAAVGTADHVLALEEIVHLLNGL